MPREVCEAKDLGAVLALGAATRQDARILSRVVGERRDSENDIMCIIGVR